MKMRVHYFQHVPFEGLGSIEYWLKEKNAKISHTKFFESDKLPDTNDIDILIVMGGPMSVNDEEKYPWLVKEKEFVKRAVKSGKSVLGICLGAQLIANALGAKVYKNQYKEIGWFPIKGVKASNNEVFQFPSSFTAFHWHGETFDLPTGAILLAKSEACTNQAFQIGRTVIGLQFHLETTLESLKAIVENCRDELIQSKYVQSEESILSYDKEVCYKNNMIMNEILSYLCQF